MAYHLIPLLLAASAAAAAQTDLPTGPQLLAQTLAYHDPDGTWMEQRVELRLETGYADGTKRVRLATVDFARADYRDRVEQDDRVLEQEVRGDECRFWIDGQEDADPALLAELGLDCDGARRRRNYVSYLWGLPMKLQDPGTRVDEAVRRIRFADQEVLDLKVTYDPEVGTDVWHMYIEPSTRRLVGYAFYRTAAEERGEYIVLSDEIRVNNARIPAERRWYEVPGDEFLGTDTLISARIVESWPR